MNDAVKQRLTQDHVELSDSLTLRRYFETFARITGHLGRVAAELETEGRLNRTETRILGRYLAALTRSLQALSLKYAMTGRADGALGLSFDGHESGFPVAQEVMQMAVDAANLGKHLSGIASVEELKDRMVRQIVGKLTVPTALQFALSQRLYYEALAQGGLFLSRNDPEAQWTAEQDGRRAFLIHWAVYDTQVNLPVVYLMDAEDSGRKPLPIDDRRWPRVQQHLMAQSMNGLKLLTIATGLDADFPDLHPKRLRRLHLGPVYSDAFTQQSGPISEVLSTAKAPEGEDWALVWTIEDLVADRAEQVKDGWFSTVERQIFKRDPFLAQDSDHGATSMERMVILPERPFQVLMELTPPGFRSVRKFIVGAGGRILSTR